MSATSRYEEILGLADTDLSKEEILKRLKAFEDKSAKNVQMSVTNYVHKINEIIDLGAKEARKTKPQKESR